MAESNKLDRRDFLRVSAVAAGGTMLAACGGGGNNGAPAGATRAAAPSNTAVAAPEAEATIPVKAVEQQPTVVAPAQFNQAPSLGNVAGLPPVAERLPKNPYVVPHEWVKQGKYGGHMRMAASDVWGTAHFWVESQYGHSPLRWLKDGKAIGPGLAESWKPNKANTEWTLNFREGLKWSDGKPWTTKDVQFWWEDMVANEDHPATAPTELKSSKGTPATMRYVDDTTLVVSFDSPQPLFADLTACWVKGFLGPRFMAPRHYAEQFHPKYNAKLKNKKDWATELDSKLDYGQNPDCPTMNGWKLKSYKEGQQSNWERNPYYYAVTKEGDQLPYIDSVSYTYVQNPEVLRLRISNGQVDYVHGAHSGLTLSDVAPLRQNQQKAGTIIDFWDSGSGTGSIMFLNLDYEVEAERNLFRDKRFRRAISHAFDRERVRRTVYFNQGTPTTGTLSPKAVEYRINEEARKRYEEWRSSYVEYSPEKANKLLDEIGMKKGGDGFRTLPNGQKFTLRLEFGAPGSQEHIRKNEILAENLRAVGVNCRLNPVPSEGIGERYAAGKLHTNSAWEVGDGPNHLAYAEWIVPQTTDRWASMHGAYYSQVKGTPREKKEANIEPYKRTPRWVAPEKGGAIDRIYNIYQNAKQEVDPLKRTRLVWDIIKVHVDEGPFFIGSVNNYPQLVVKKQTLMNVPSHDELRKFAQGGWTNPWIMPSPAVYDPEAYFWSDPENHQSQT